jgi:hypothetical protein
MLSASPRSRISQARQRGRPRVARDFQAWPQRAQTRHGRSTTSTVNAADSSRSVVISTLVSVAVTLRVDCMKAVATKGAAECPSVERENRA